MDTAGVAQSLLQALPSTDATLRALLSAAAAADSHATDTNHTTDAAHGSGHGASHGSKLEHTIAVALQWVTVVVAIIQLGFYGWHSFKATTGWEEVYVCVLELVKVFIEIFHEFDSPATIYQTNGNHVVWLRYAEWLLTCPVMLIHLSNLTGMHEEYSKRTMTLLVTDIGCIVWGITAALTKGPLKILFFMIALSYGSTQFFQAAKVYIESYHSLPKGPCRKICKLMAYEFFCSWLMFPVLFIAGPEGLNILSPYGSGIGHLVLDLISKNLWGFFGHHLRVKIREHILIHGDIRKKTTINIAGEEMTIETFVDEEDDETVKHSTRELAHRESFQRMGDNMRARGLPVRDSLDANAEVPLEDMENKVAHKQAQGNMASINPGRVVLIVPDMSMVEYFRDQFNQLPTKIELQPALGIDTGLQMVQQIGMMGGADFVLVHPEFLQDRTQNSLLMRLKMMGQRVCAFGWLPVGPVRDLIEQSGVDGWLEGPSFGAGISQAQLASLINRMQTLKAQTGMIGTGMMSMNMHSMNPMMMTGGLNPIMSGNLLSVNSMTPLVNPMATGQSSNPLYGQQMTPPGMSPAASMTMGSRPGTAPSPMQASPAGLVMNSALYGNTSPRPPTQPPSSAGGGSMAEGDMLNALMSEISRLKTELGEN